MIFEFRFACDETVEPAIVNGKEIKMQKDMVECPRDSKVKYSRDVFENVFRKGNIRVWCKTCEVFSNDQTETEQRHVPSV